MTIKTTPNDANGIAGETRWTPGPWEAHFAIDGDPIWDVTAKHGWTPNSNGVTPHGWFVASVHEVTNLQSAEATARLIASAPDLLEALQNIAALAAKCPAEGGPDGNFAHIEGFARADISKTTRDTVGGV